MQRRKYASARHKPAKNGFSFEKAGQNRTADQVGAGTLEMPASQPTTAMARRLFRSPEFYGSRVDTAGPYPRLYTAHYSIRLRDTVYTRPTSVPV